jgi:hypothetical protein
MTEEHDKPRLCKDCTHFYLPHGMPLVVATGHTIWGPRGPGRCQRPSLGVEPVMGGKVTADATAQRNSQDATDCGPDGTFYEHRASTPEAKQWWQK